MVVGAAAGNNCINLISYQIGWSFVRKEEKNTHNSMFIVGILPLMWQHLQPIFLKKMAAIVKEGCWCNNQKSQSR